MNNLLNIKSFLKFLSRNKGYTAIDVFGLSVSLMFVILIAVYVERELNIDKQQANYDRIVAIGNEEFLESGVPVSYWLEERYPEIEKVCPVITDQGKSKQIFYGDKKLTADLVYADSTFSASFRSRYSMATATGFWKILIARSFRKALPVRCSAMTIRSGRACASATRRVSWLPVSWKTSTVR